MPTRIPAPSTTPPRATPGARASAGAAIVGLLLTLPGSVGCLSHEHRVHPDALAALAATPPEQRGQPVRVVQKLGARRAAPVAPAAAPPPPPPPPPAYPPDAYQGGPNVWVGVQVGVPVDHGPRPGPPGVRPPSSGFGQPAPPMPSGKSGGSSGGAPSPGSDALTDDLRVLAIVVVAVAAFAAVGLLATEGARYDGYAALAPTQPLHLRSRSAGDRVITVADLRPHDLAGLDEAVVADDEGYGLYLLGRAPLDRRGFAFKLDFGSTELNLGRYLTSGFASSLQLGYFPLQHLGLLATAQLGFGTSDLERRDFFRNTLGLEAQGFLPGLSFLHLGGYLNAGNQLVTADGGFRQSRPIVGAGLLLEIELTTRLALTARAGWTWTNLPGGGWEAGGFQMAGGVAIY